MAQIIDKIVNISITDATSSVETTDVNTVAIVGASGTDGAEAGSYSSSSAVGEAYGTESELYKMAAVFFGQEACPDQVVCIPAGSSLTENLANVQAAAESYDFYHVCINAQSDTAASEVTTLNLWLAEAHKVAHVQCVYTATIAECSALVVEGNTRVAIYRHATGGEYLHVAIVAKRCGTDSARGTFAHKTVTGVTTDTYTADDYSSAVDAGVNVYTKVAGTSRLFMGTTASASDFIDSVVKDDWVRFNVQSKIYALLGDANDGAGLNYNDAGIAAVAACVTNVLAVAEGTGREYVMSGYSVSYKDYEYLAENNASDVTKRNLPLITGTYQRMNSIHTVDTVSLTVTL